MAEIIIETEERQAFRPSFIFWITVIMALLVFGGFGLTYWQPMLSGTLPPLPPVVHIHGLVFFSWMVILIIQSLLVNAGNVQLHRKLGKFGIGVGAAMLAVGALITVLFGRFQGANPTPDYHNLMYLSVISLISFALLFFLAIRNVNHTDRHKRLIIFATMSLLAPGINRLYMVVFSMNDLPLLAMYLTVDILVAAMLVFDWRSMSRIHAASLIGAAVVFVPQLVRAPVVESGTFAALCELLGSIAYYR